MNPTLSWQRLKSISTNENNESRLTSSLSIYQTTVGHRATKGNGQSSALILFVYFSSLFPGRLGLLKT